MFSDWHMKNRMKARLKKMKMDNRVKLLQLPYSDMNDEDINSRALDFLLKEVNQVLGLKSEEGERGGFCEIQEYPSSKFEDVRNSLAIKGLCKTAGDCPSESFLQEMLAELLKWTDEISIIDYSIGENWRSPEGRLSGNYPPALIEWCNYLISLNRKIRVTLHTRGGHCGMIQEKINELTRESRVAFTVTKHDKLKVPHLRFVYANGFLISIDPGIDLFKDGYVKDISARIYEDDKALALVSRGS